MNEIQIFPRDAKEYRLLTAAAELMTAFSPTGVLYYVGQTYFDFGQGWKWTTIIAERKNGDSWQALYPALQNKIVNAKSAAEISEAVTEFFEHTSLDK